MQLPNEQRAEEECGPAAEQGIEVEQERQAETWQRDMRDDVGRKDHSLHQCEAAHQAGNDGEQERQDDAIDGSGLSHA